MGGGGGVSRGEKGGWQLDSEEIRRERYGGLSEGGGGISVWRGAGWEVEEMEEESMEVYACMHVNIYVYMYMCMNIYICMYLSI